MSTHLKDQAQQAIYAVRSTLDMIATIANNNGTRELKEVSLCTACIEAMQRLDAAVDVVDQLQEAQS